MDGRRRLNKLALAIHLGLVLACTEESGPALSKPSETIPKVVEVNADNPKIGIVADFANVLEQPAPAGKVIGYLRAGTRLPASKQTYPGAGCKAGYYAVRPRGFVCGDNATDDLDHPTLVAMALAAKLDEPLPYTYARTTKTTSLFKRDPSHEAKVKEVKKLKRNTGLAIVGSWVAEDPEGKQQRLGLTLDGHFVKANELRAAEPSSFSGTDLTQEEKLPVGFVVKRGVSAWKIDEDKPEKLDELDYHEKLSLNGQYRTINDLRFWELKDERYVRHRDVTVVRRRHILPDFVTPDLKWVDISVITGTAVFYEGKTPVFATLVSVGRDRLGDPKTTDSTEMGTFEVVRKEITGKALDPDSLALYYPVHDAPWVLELSSGQHMLGSYWHNRFGIEHTDGAVHLSPADAQRLWTWIEPPMLDGWDAVVRPEGASKSLVLIRK